MAHCRQMENAPDVPLKGKNLRIMCIGDSVTAGPAGTNSYRAKLVKGLHGNTIDMVGSAEWGTQNPPQLNRFEGQMSATIEDITAKMVDSLPKRRPNVILIHLGTNDVAWKKDLATAPERMKAAIDLALESCPDAVVLVALICPVSFRNDEIRHFNSALAKLIADRAVHGARILTVDMWGAFEASGHPNYMEDVAHPNLEGYSLMADMWLEGMRRANGLGWIRDPVKMSS